MDGLAAVMNRIASIEAIVAPRAPRSAPQTTAGSGPLGTRPGGSAGADFERLYAGALAQAAPLRSAQRLEPGQYGPLQPPSELLPFGNGRVPPHALSSIGHGDHRLHAPAAHAFNQMEAAARAEGVSFGVIASFRDLATQERLAQEKGLYSQGGLAAAPGTSNHGWGLSVDLDLDARAQAWMRENGWRFGFVEDVPREPWHWTYRPA